MFYVYLLRSKKDKKFYIGSTSNLKRRVKEHNSKKVYSTKSRTPFELMYYEAFKAEFDARERESILKKRGNSRFHLLNRIKRSIH